MRIEKLSNLESYNLDLNAFRDGHFFAEDIEDENAYYDRLYALVDSTNTIYALAYIILEEDGSSLEVDLLTARDEEQESEHKIRFLRFVQKHFWKIPRIVLKGTSHREEDLVALGFRNQRGEYLVWEKGNDIDKA